MASVWCDRAYASTTSRSTPSDTAVRFVTSRGEGARSHCPERVDSLTRVLDASARPRRAALSLLLDSSAWIAVNSSQKSPLKTAATRNKRRKMYTRRYKINLMALLGCLSTVAVGVLNL